MVAEFDQKFTSDRINPYLLRMLTTPESLSGILNLLVYEAMMCYQQGLYESAAMVEARDEYISGLTKLYLYSIFLQHTLRDSKSWSILDIYLSL